MGFRHIFHVHHIAVPYPVIHIHPQIHISWALHHYVCSKLCMNGLLALVLRLLLLLLLLLLLFVKRFNVCVCGGGGGVVTAVFMDVLAGW